MKFSVYSREVKGIAILELKGRLMLGDGTRILRDQVCETLGGRGVVLNLARVSHLDSAGLGELISARDAVVARGGHLKLTGLHRRIADLMKVTRIYCVFDVFESEAAAIESFPDPEPASLQSRWKDFMEHAAKLGATRKTVHRLRAS
jgi:anti-sigma B factor antagonist